jgi:3-hydroxyisobutyrate dehydrogenase-like beta-hydroxyacid dehydrogenase
MLSTMPDRLMVAVLGLGEAGSAFAADFTAAGADVTGYDPRGGGAPSATEAVRVATLVLSVNTAAVAERVADESMPAVPPGAVWADLNTSAPSLKARLADRAVRHGLRFADVALMAAVPGRGVTTPSLAAGPGAAEYARIVGGYGGRVEVVAGPPGTAAARKLLRSVVLKSLATSIIEALTAARAAECEEWLRGELAGQFGAELVDRLERGTYRHAARRVDEMVATGQMLAELGTPARMTEAARAWLDALASREE